jgi:hypothetical protein
LGGDGRDTTEDCLSVVFELNEQELPVHGRGLEVAPVGQDKVRMEFHTAL